MPAHTPATIRSVRGRISCFRPSVSFILRSCLSGRPPRPPPWARRRARHTLAGRTTEENPPMPTPSQHRPAGLDLLQIEDQLTEDERLVRDTVRGYAADKVMPHLADWFEAGTLPREPGPGLRKLRLVRMRLDGYGLP